MTAYQGDAERDAEAMAGGCYHTGDLASRDADGYITYVGRTDDVFKASDYKISPFELESVLIEHPAVAEAAIVPAPDEVRLAVPKAYVALAAGHEPSPELALEILMFARDNLAPYLRIRRLEFARPAEDDLGQDPPRRAARSGGRRRRGRRAARRGVPLRGLPRAPLLSRGTSVTAVVAPTGDQFEISGGGYRAVVTEGGATLRLLEHDGRPLLDGFDEDEMPKVGRGQMLMPWPNRIRDGRYSFGDRDLQLALSEAARGNASHGLVRWAAWSLEEQLSGSVSLTYRLMAQSGYPWTLDLHVLFDLSADGLTVTQTATNLSSSPAPVRERSPPLPRVGDGPVDGWELTLPASTRLLTDDQLIPVGEEAVEDTTYDFRVSRPVRDTVVDHAFGDLDRDPPAWRR